MSIGYCYINDNGDLELATRDEVRFNETAYSNKVILDGVTGLVNSGNSCSAWEYALKRFGALDTVDLFSMLWKDGFFRAPCVKKLIFNDPATVVFWTDGTKTVVKCGLNEKFDPEKGLAMAFTKKILGNKGSYFNTIKKAIIDSGYFNGSEFEPKNVDEYYQALWYKNHSTLMVDDWLTNYYRHDVNVIDSLKEAVSEVNNRLRNAVVNETAPSHKNEEMDICERKCPSISKISLSMNIPCDAPFASRSPVYSVAVNDVLRKCYEDQSRVSVADVIKHFDADIDIGVVTETGGLSYYGNEWSADMAKHLFLTGKWCTDVFVFDGFIVGAEFEVEYRGGKDAK